MREPYATGAASLTAQVGDGPLANRIFDSCPWGEAPLPTAQNGSQVGIAVRRRLRAAGRPTEKISVPAGHSTPSYRTFPGVRGDRFRHPRPDALVITEDDMDKLLLTPIEAAAALGIGRFKVYELLQSGQLQSVRIGTCRRIPADALAVFLERLRAAG